MEKVNKQSYTTDKRFTGKRPCSNSSSDLSKCSGPKENKHSGQVKRYLVVDSGKNLNWGEFFYCDSCADIDRKNGFKLKEI